MVCGYALAERLLFNIAMCGYTNFAELPGAANMLNTKADRISVRLSHRDQRVFQLFFDLMASSIKYLPDAYYKEAAKALNESDRAIMADAAVKEHFIADQKEAFAQGSKGTAVDAAVHYVDLGFRCKLQYLEKQGHLFPVNHQDLIFETAKMEL